MENFPVEIAQKWLIPSTATLNFCISHFSLQMACCAVDFAFLSAYFIP